MSKIKSAEDLNGECVMGDTQRWMRELCVQIAALREALTQPTMVQETIIGPVGCTFHPGRPQVGCPVCDSMRPRQTLPRKLRRAEISNDLALDKTLDKIGDVVRHERKKRRVCPSCGCSATYHAKDCPCQCHVV